MGSEYRGINWGGSFPCRNTQSSQPESLIASKSAVQLFGREPGGSKDTIEATNRREEDFSEVLEIV